MSSCAREAESGQGTSRVPWSAGTNTDTSPPSRLQIFKEGLTNDGSEHIGLYARRPLVDEPPARLATLPPTLLLYGERDWVWTPSVLQAAEEAIPRCTLRVVEHAQHHLYLDVPDQFHKLVTEAITGEGAGATRVDASV